MLLDEIFDKKELKFYKEISVRDNQTNSKINFPCFCILKNFLNIIQRKQLFRCQGRLQKLIQCY